MDYNSQIEIVRGAAKAVELNKVTVLTGKNGSGKSLLRKMLPGAIAEKTGADSNHIVASVSMETRTQRKFEFSAFNSLGIDDPDNPTSLETLYKINKLFEVCSAENQRFLVIDEPEIGMGEEMVVAITVLLNKTLESLPEGCLGVLVITHNRHIVSNLIGDFINLEGMTREEWLNREIIPTDLNQLEEDAIGLYRAIVKKIQEKNND